MRFSGRCGKATLLPTRVLPTPSVEEKLLSRLARKKAEKGASCRASSLELSFTIPRTRWADVLAPSGDHAFARRFLRWACKCFCTSLSPKKKKLCCRLIGGLQHHETLTALASIPGKRAASVCFDRQVAIRTPRLLRSRLRFRGT